MKRNSRLKPSFKPAWWIGVLTLFTLLLAACAPPATPVPTNTPAPTATSAPTMAPTMTPAPTTPPEAELNVTTDATLGKILTGANGMTLYMYAKDTPETSTCAGNCLKSWPPLLTTTGAITVGTGISNSLIGTAALADGTKIVTYNKMPLYYWAADTKPGDALGQGINDVWYMVALDGKPIMK